MIGSRIGTWSDLDKWKSGGISWGILGKSFILLLWEQTLPLVGRCEGMCGVWVLEFAKTIATTVEAGLGGNQMQKRARQKILKKLYWFHRAVIARPQKLGNLNYKICLPVLEARSLRSKCRQVGCFWGMRGDCPGLSPSFWWSAAVFGVPWLVDILPVCVSVSVSNCPLLTRTQVIRDYSPLQPPQFNLVTSVGTLFPNKVTWWGPGGQDSNIAFWGGDTIQLITKMSENAVSQLVTQYLKTALPLTSALLEPLNTIKYHFYFRMFGLNFFLFATEKLLIFLDRQLGKHFRTFFKQWKDDIRL